MFSLWLKLTYSLYTHNISRGVDIFQAITIAFIMPFACLIIIIACLFIAHIQISTRVSVFNKIGTDESLDFIEMIEVGNMLME